MSDLELTILGIVWKKGPCTSYVVAREFVTSPSSHWSGSAGAIYPAVQRLARRRYLKAEKESDRGRTRRLYTITERGLEALRQWLLPPFPDSAAQITFDPIRTRAYFLALLGRDQRKAFLDEAEEKLGAQIPVLRAECERYRRAGDSFSEIAMSGALFEIEGRLEWIRAIRNKLVDLG